MTIQEQVIQTFVEQYNGEPSIIVRAPGRVNLIGEHTDYNDGYVLPMAIDRAVWVALRPRTDRRVTVYAADYQDGDTFLLNELPDTPPEESETTTAMDYIRGVAWAMQRTGYQLSGWEGVVQGDVPIGAGLSSSAAIEMAIAQAFCAVSDIAWYAPSFATLGQQVENDWIGVQSGIMDQMISAGGRSGNALLIDCRNLHTRFVPLPTSATVVVLDTNTRRGLVNSEYNKRRQQCEIAAAYLGVQSLRDMNLQDFAPYESDDEFDELAKKRARHVITENARVLQAIEAMQQDDPQALGRLMNESHISMRDDFEITNNALNAIVECAQSYPRCYGARMTGGGFGGCAVALVDSDSVPQFVDYVSLCYTNKTNRRADIYLCQPTDGAAIVSQS